MKIKEIALPHLLAAAIALNLAVTLFTIFWRNPDYTALQTFENTQEFIGAVIGVVGAFGAAILSFRLQRNTTNKKHATIIAADLCAIGINLTRVYDYYNEKRTIDEISNFIDRHIEYFDKYNDAMKYRHEMIYFDIDTISKIDTAISLYKLLIFSIKEGRRTFYGYFNSKHSDDSGIPINISFISVMISLRNAAEQVNDKYGASTDKNRIYDQLEKLHDYIEKIRLRNIEQDQG